MDIRHLNASQLREQAGARGKAEGTQNSQNPDAAASRPGTDSVELSADAAALKEVSLQNNVQPFDESRVEAIRQAISEGRYHVDPERLAENFTRLESQIIQ